MIWETLSFLAGKLNTAIKSRYNITHNMVQLAALPLQPGGIIETDNKILLTLVNVEPDHIAQDLKPIGKQSFTPDLFVNLYILVSAYSTEENYDQALKILSGIVSFFQANPFFAAQNEPALGPYIEKLNIEMSKISLHDQSTLWTTLGSKYLPSALYKVRLLRFRNEQYSPEWPAISGIE
ncbi:MAG: DUF4255 domain-containing protein [Chitinophagaceae bacterium]